MILSFNPSDQKIAELIKMSEHKAAKWLKDTKTGDRWFWPAGSATHAQMASHLHIDDYDKGIAIDS